MVALNPAYAPCKSTDTVNEARQRVDGAPEVCPKGGLKRVPGIGRFEPQNRVGDFFCESTDRVGGNRLSGHWPRLENELTFTITASGRPYFINQDPIGFDGGMNWFAFASGSPIGFIDPNGFKDFGLTNTDPNFVRPQVESFGDFIDIMFTDFPAAVYDGVSGIPGQMAERGREIKQGGDVLSVYIGGSIEFAGGTGGVIKVPENLFNLGSFAVRYSGMAGGEEQARAELEAQAMGVGLQNLPLVYETVIKGKELEILGGALSTGGLFSKISQPTRGALTGANFAGKIVGPVSNAHNQIDNFTGFSSGFTNTNDGYSNFTFSNESSFSSFGFK